jgi:hypothetical protein
MFNNVFVLMLNTRCCLCGIKRLFNYMLVHGLFNMNATYISSQCYKRHNCKIFKPRYEHCFALQFFSYRVIAVGNFVPNGVVCAHNINAFKFCLNDFNFSKFHKGRAIY